MNDEQRFDRQTRFFGRDGQARIGAAKVAVIGIGGLGTHVVQHLSLLGVKHLALVDAQEVDSTNLNRYIGVRHDDSIPGTLKVDIGARIAHSIDPNIHVDRIDDSLVSVRAYSIVKAADYVIGSIDNEGVRLVLNELCAAYAKPYLDLASDIVSGENIGYGGRIAVAWDGTACLACLGAIDLREAQLQLAGPDAQRDHEAIYGVRRNLLGQSGPSVVSINGTIASLGITEFIAGVTGLRRPFNLQNYYGHLGKMTVSKDPPISGCLYCAGIRGKGEAAHVERYITAGVGSWLR